VAPPPFMIIGRSWVILGGLGKTSTPDL